jgi:gluconolactonase
MKVSWTSLAGIISALVIFSFTEVNASVIAPGAQLQKIASGYSFTEGPAVDAAGNVFFTDQPNNKIMKLSTNGTLSVFLTPCGRANGMYFDRDGNLWACADEHNELWKISPQGNVTVVIKDFQGKLLNGPNDMWIARSGGIYFTDPLYSRSYWNHRSGKALVSGQHVYYLTPDLQTLIQVTSDLQQPNGIIGTPDGRFLYVGDYQAKMTYRFTIQPDGKLGEKSLICSSGSDGMTMDNEGNIYLTSSGVKVYNSSGKLIESISVSETTTNVTFGGPDNKTLYVTAGGSLYSLRMSVQGAVLQPDFNLDERVNFMDYARLVQSWELDDPNVDLGPTTLGDGVIDNRDMKMLADSWLGEVMPVGLKAYWKMDEPNGTKAYDSVGGYDATVTGDVLWQPEGGMVNGAVVLDGNDYFTTPFVQDPSTGTFSVFAWIKGGLPGQVILSQKGGTDWLSTDAADGKLMTSVIPPASRTGAAPPLVSDYIVTDDNWHYVGLVWNGSDRILYADGNEVKRDVLGKSLTSYTSGLYIGAGKGLQAGSFWSGSIDDVRLYNRAIVP